MPAIQFDRVNPDGQPLGYVEVSYPEPHIGRAKKIVVAHPEVRKLFGPTPISALCILGIVAVQMVVAVLLRDASIWALLLVAYTLGAACNHALFVMIHECAHNLVFRDSRANRLISIVANLPIVFPAAMGFRNFHLVHHRHQGELDLDADLAGPNEAKWVGNSTIRKAIWCLFFFVVEGIIRPNRIKNVKVLDGWVVFNTAALIVMLAPFTYFFGWMALTYLFLSTVFAIGLHPLGARWIQEHYTFHGKQETYSYYGPLNRIMFNVGYHNEHHDLVMVPWTKLPALRRMAPEFYDSLYYHMSYTRLMSHFLFGNVDLFRRVIRSGVVKKTTAVDPAQCASACIAAATPEPAVVRDSLGINAVPAN